MTTATETRKITVTVTGFPGDEEPVNLHVPLALADPDPDVDEACRELGRIVGDAMLDWTHRFA
jgi:hypothetical protein